METAYKSYSISDILLNKSIKIGNLTLRNPTLKDIFEFGKRNYQEAINLFTFQPSDYMIELDDVGKDFTKVDTYELFISLCLAVDEKEAKDREKEAKEDSYEKFISKRVDVDLSWLTGLSGWKVGISKVTNECVLYYDSSAIISRVEFFQIREYLCKINFIPNVRDKINPANEITKKMMIENQREENEYNKKHNHNKDEGFLENVISCVVWANSCGINYFNVMDLTIYELLDGFFRINKIKNYQNVMLGVYTGNISSKDSSKLIESAEWTSNFK